MKLFWTTNRHKRYWSERKIDWKKAYLDTWDHPHRTLISRVLSNLSWLSLVEIGCGAGANLRNIITNIPGRQVGGIDINTDAIELAQKSFIGGQFRIGSGEDIMMSDKSSDIVLTDAMLIYVGPNKIDKYIKEIKRIARNYAVFCEFHTTSLWNKLALKFNSGYFAYDYKKLLEKHGFYDIQIFKIPKEVWSGTPWEEFGNIIVAK